MLNKISYLIPVTIKISYIVYKISSIKISYIAYILHDNFNFRYQYHNLDSLYRYLLYLNKIYKINQDINFGE